LAGRFVRAFGRVVAMIAHGTRRFRVIEWLPDDPYPRARVEWMDEDVWDESLRPVRERVEREVRRALAVGAEFGDVAYSAAVELDDDPVDAVWQLAAITPLNELDQLRLLRAESIRELLEELEPMAVTAATSLRAASLFDDLDGSNDVES